MTWNFAEGNPFSHSTGNFLSQLKLIDKFLDAHPSIGSLSPPGSGVQADAAKQSLTAHKVVSADTPSYDNIGYADLSDYFHVWLRRSLRPVFPDLCSTLAVPKSEELVATPYRHGSKEAAERFFLRGMMTDALRVMAVQAHPVFPVTVYYAFKQSETKRGKGTASTGWETFLDAVIRSGFTITGTWPMRTELANRMIGFGTNALASSIVLVCRRRPCHSARVPRRTARRAALGPRSSSFRQHCSRRSCAGRHRAGHGGIHPPREIREERALCGPVLRCCLKTALTVRAGSGHTARLVAPAQRRKSKPVVNARRTKI